VRSIKSPWDVNPKATAHEADAVHRCPRKRCQRSRLSGTRAGCQQQDPRRSCRSWSRLPKEEGGSSAGARACPCLWPPSKQLKPKAGITAPAQPTEELAFRFSERLNAHTAAETEYKAGYKLSVKQTPKLTTQTQRIIDHYGFDLGVP